MTTFTTSGRIRYTLRAESALVPVANPIEMDLGLDFAHLTKYFLGVQMFNGSGALTVASAGEFTVQIKTLNTLLYEPIEGKAGAPKATIRADAPTTNTWTANTIAVRVTPTMVSGQGVVNYKVVLTANKN